MGTAPPSKPAEPSNRRPFLRQQPQDSVTNPMHLRQPTRQQRKATTLLHLVSRRDWQKVLIRASLFPDEISKPQRMEWYGIKWNLLPLHLACALDPPPQVIATLLQYRTANTASVIMTRTKPGLNTELDLNSPVSSSSVPSDFTRPVNTGNRKKLRGKLARLRRRGSGAKGGNDESKLPSNGTISETSRTSSTPKETSPLPSSLSEQHEDHPGGRKPLVAVQQLSSSRSNSEVNEDSRAHSPLLIFSSFSIDDDDSENSVSKFLEREGMALQLTPTGRLCVAKASPAASAAQAPESCMQRKDIVTPSEPTQMDRMLLLQNADKFLPVHIACLYRASPQVLKLLVEAYPFGALTSNSSLGMLPIHIVCAGISLPPPTPVSQDPLVASIHQAEGEEWNLTKALKVLIDSVSEGCQFPSNSSGKTPSQYIKESLEEGEEKNQCLQLLESNPNPLNGSSGEEVQGTTKIKQTSSLKEESIDLSAIQCEDTAMQVNWDIPEKRSGGCDQASLESSWSEGEWSVVAPEFVDGMRLPMW